MPQTDILNTSEVVGKDVFTSQGAYCGKARDLEINLPKFKVRALIIDAAKGSYLAQKVGGKKGVIVPYSMVNAVSDIIVIKHFSGDVEPGEEEGYDKEIEEEERYEKERTEERL
ncbi:MAG: PRC-barrel domain-containing protein [Candidatus Nanohaloarchaea archaeon]|nr:PRC-barrel domain-containing protein [Candidatus Nanohaloarchaea archaeon]